MPDLQTYLWNLNPIKNMEDTVVFLTCKKFISVNFSIPSYEQDTQVSFPEKPQSKINSFKKLKLEYLIVTWLLQSFQGNRCESGIAILFFAYTQFRDINGETKPAQYRVGPGRYLLHVTKAGTTGRLGSNSNWP